MRTLFLVAIFLSAACGGFSPADNDNAGAVPPVAPAVDAAFHYVDLHVNGVGLGTTETELIEKLGDPKSTATEGGPCDGKGKVLAWDGLKIVVLQNQDGSYTAQRLSINAAQWEVSGIHLGSTKDEVRATLGRRIAGDTMPVH